MKINYKKFKCPKCGKSHFIIKELSNDFFPFIFTQSPVYLNSKLTQPIVKYCKCKECDCNFRVKILGKHYSIFNEDKEREETLKKFQETQRDKQLLCKKEISNELPICDIKVVENTIPHTTNKFQDILDRLSILETKVNQLMEKDK